MNQHVSATEPGLVVSLIGFSGSGKSTVARALVDRFRRDGWNVLHLDRSADHAANDHAMAQAGFASDASHELPEITLDRTETEYRAFNEHLARAAREVSSMGVTVILSQISPYREIRDELRAAVGSVRYFEIHVDTPLDVCEARDPKGLYRHARAGTVAFMPGVSSRFDPPLQPFLTVSSRGPADVTRAVEQIADRLGLHAVPCASFDAVVVDLFGTLLDLPSVEARRVWIDTMAPAAQPFTRELVMAGAWYAPLFETMGVPHEAGRDLLMTTRLDSVQAAADVLAPMARRSAPPDVIEQYERGLAQWRSGFRRSPAARTLLDALHDGGIPIAILSNADSLSAAVVSELGMDSQIKAVLLSCDLGLRKPDARAFTAAFDALGVAAADVLVVGDSWTSDAAGAVLAGASAVWVNHHGIAAPGGLPMPWRRRIVEVPSVDALTTLLSHE